jgi:hypothetical protein
MGDLFYIIGGVLLSLFGILLTIYEIRIFVRGQQGDLGYDVKGLGLGITFIILGILMITGH